MHIDDGHEVELLEKDGEGWIESSGKTTSAPTNTTALGSGITAVRPEAWRVQRARACVGRQVIVR